MNYNDHTGAHAVGLILAPSRAAVWIVGAMALTALAVLAATPGAMWLRVLVATWVVCAAIEWLHSVALHRGPRGVRGVVVAMTGEIRLRSGLGEWRNGTLRPGSFVAPWLTILRWRAPGHRIDRTIVILPDMVPAEDFRRLRVMLRWG